MHISLLTTPPPVNSSGMWPVMVAGLPLLLTSNFLWLSVDLNLSVLNPSLILDLQHNGSQKLAVGYYSVPYYSPVDYINCINRVIRVRN